MGKKPMETLARVARYYIEEMGYKPADARNKLDAFIIQCDPSASLVAWADRADKALKNATKYRSVKIDYLSVTEPEIKRIELLKGKQLKRLAFTLLCLAKYYHAIRPDSAYWVGTKDSEIMAMANVNTSLKRQALLYSSLKDEGLIEFSRKVDNTNIRICFAEDGDEAIRITDLRNLGYQYLMYCGEPYFKCSSCGITTKILHPENKRKQKYCRECANKIYIQQIMDSVMRKRNTDFSKMFKVYTPCEAL